ncbi:MAG: hypothetical protein EKK48_18990 [Candidatus Melainabacteria bacterium]|nr:MAG: hypothetical protein EKK48_18990 [Candidatus Melainabacteria bacterium]
MSNVHHASANVDSINENTAWWADLLFMLPGLMEQMSHYHSVSFQIPKDSYNEVFGFHRECYYLPSWKTEPRGWLVDLIERLKDLGFEPKIRIYRACTGGVANGIYLYSELFVPLKGSGQDFYDSRFSDACFDKPACRRPEVEISNEQVFMLVCLIVAFGLFAAGFYY